ncbi:hypothetical protein D9M72_572420 [compost metagenome]
MQAAEDEDLLAAVRKALDGARHDQQALAGVDDAILDRSVLRMLQALAVLDEHRSLPRCSLGRDPRDRAGDLKQVGLRVLDQRRARCLQHAHEGLLDGVDGVLAVSEAAAEETADPALFPLVKPPHHRIGHQSASPACGCRTIILNVRPGRCRLS